MFAFANCSSLKEIRRYAGSQKDWKRIIKDDGWDENIKNYNIIFNFYKTM